MSVGQEEILVKMEKANPFPKIINIFTIDGKTKDYVFLWYFIRGGEVKKLTFLVRRKQFRERPDHYLADVLYKASFIFDKMKQEDERE